MAKGGVAIIYLTTGTSPAYWPQARARGFGHMLTPSHGRRLILAQALQVWAADNECFASAERFDFGVWLAWLDAMQPARPTCLFAAVPDVVGDAASTLVRWNRWSPAVRATGYPLAYVAQDGQPDSPIPWDDLDTLFIGGTTEWKVSHPTAQLVREARARGKPVHMGRVNSERRLLYAARLGCGSCDGTFMAINPRKALRVMGRAVARANAPQLPLPVEVGTAAAMGLDVAVAALEGNP